MTYTPTSHIRKKPHCLYRVFTEANELLYVGCSMGPLMRITSHCNKQPWRKLIASVTIEWHENWDAARDAETSAIREESPIWNVHHKQGERIQARGIFDRDYCEDDPSTWIIKVSAQ